MSSAEIFTQQAPHLIIIEFEYDKCSKLFVHELVQ